MSATCVYDQSVSSFYSYKQVSIVHTPRGGATRPSFVISATHYASPQAGNDRKFVKVADLPTCKGKRGSCLTNLGAGCRTR
ncbi:hypothetical protein LSAT2_026813 [Lamellibrachia satsuma]|nr:hypothetical protein LSAT2_026813 [Lamellibrachia satsuma]